MSERDPVIAWRGAATYAKAPPFHPATTLPEFPDVPAGQGPNPAFDAVRSCLELAGRDAACFGTPDWNPLADVIRPGQTVLLKPNFVKDSHPRDPEGWAYTVTHGSLIRAVAEYVAKALGGKGTILIGDAPQTEAPFDRICALTGTTDVVAYLRGRGLDVRLVDFRREQWTEQGGVITGRKPLPGDPAGSVRLDLGSDSRFFRHRGEGRYYGAYYDSEELNAHHRGAVHEYLLTGSAIACDVFVNLPKLKTHKKTGVTLNLKNLVGINGDKNWLPHHTEGTPEQGGDQFPSESWRRLVERNAGRALRKLAVKVPYVGPRLLRFARNAGASVMGDTETVVRSGNWHGNDTTWRMSLDLNAALLFGNPDSTWRRGGPRKPHLSFVDGLIAGEGSGPLNPDPVHAGLVVFGTNPADVDTACAWLMGFDPEKLPVIREAYAPNAFRIADGSWREVVVKSQFAAWNGPVSTLADTFRFRPHFGWTTAIERIPAHPVATDRGETR